MDECLQREWQGDKSRLFGIIAPHTGLGTAAGGAERQTGQTLGFGRITNLPPAGEHQIAALRSQFPYIFTLPKLLLIHHTFKAACLEGISTFSYIFVLLMKRMSFGAAGRSPIGNSGRNLSFLPLFSTETSAAATALCICRHNLRWRPQAGRLARRICTGKTYKKSQR